MGEQREYGGRRIGKTAMMKELLALEQTKRYVEGLPALKVLYVGQKDYIDAEFTVIAGELPEGREGKKEREQK